MIFVTGGAGFIGSNFIRCWLEAGGESIVNIDRLTYAGNPANLLGLTPAQHLLSRTDICDEHAIAHLFALHQPSALIHFAAETHVDRSILGPDEFIRTNVLGTFNLLKAALNYWRQLDDARRASFRFLHVSTDEVYGSLGPADAAFSERTPYAPNSPYAASKASADHLVRAYHETYGLPTVTTNCSNNYGPYQFPEKLIPLMITHALAGKPLPVYGDGQNIRDWLYVGDHCEAILCVLKAGQCGETYNIGGNNEITNLEVVESICRILDQLRPKSSGSYASQIQFVTDRPGHDRRYAIDARKLMSQLGWAPLESFATGLTKTVTWYLEHQSWSDQVTTGQYQHWINQNYEARENL